MKTKINLGHKKTVSKFINKNKNYFKWKGKGGSNKKPNMFRGLNIYNENDNDNDNDNHNENENESNPNDELKTISNNHNHNGTFTKVARGIFKELDKSAHRFSFTYKVKKDGIDYFNEKAYKLMEVRVDLLQFYVNNNLIKLTPDNKIQINSQVLISDEREVSYSKGGTKFIDVYEDGNNDEKCYSSDGKIIKIKMLTYEESLQNLFNNKDYINTKTIDEKTNNITEFILDQDLGWVREIMSELNTINKDLIKNPKGKCNLDLFLDRKTKQFEKNERIFTKCDLNVNHNKLIIEEIVVDSETYIILGYPDITMFPYLKIYEENEDKFESVYKNHKTENNENGMTGILSHIADLNNYLYKEEDKKITTIDDIHKFFGKNTYYEKYITEYYERIVKQYTDNFFSKTKINTNSNTIINQNKSKLLDFLNKEFNKNYGINYNENFKIDFLEKQKEYYNTLAKQYLNSPMKYIKYNFIVFKKIDDYDKKKETIFTKSFIDPVKYVPAIFNFRELKGKHIIILDELKNCIYKILPKLYNIINTNTNGNEYKLFYSTYKYGTFFHIKTEYLHTLSNIFQSSYKYQITITLEELIYIVSLLNKEENLENLRIEYKTRAKTIRKDRDNAFLRNNMSKKRQSKHTKHSSKQITLKKSCDNIESDTIDKILNTQFNTNLSNITIIVLFKETGTKYTCIYKYEDKRKKQIIFYLLQFTSNLCFLEKDIKELNKIDHTINNIFECQFIKHYLINSNDLNLFKIIKHCKLTIEDYRKYLTFNPIILQNITIINKIVNNININKFYQLENISIQIPNIYKNKPIFLRNYLLSKTYITQFNIFKEKIKQDKIKSYIFVNNKTKNVVNNINYERAFSIINNKNDKINKGIINKIYFNPGNCKYNIIEIYEIIEQYQYSKEKRYKTLLWIVPINATYIENINDTNFTEFENLFNENEYKPLYLGNYLDLNENHIKLIEQIKILYLTSNIKIFLNMQSMSPTYHCLHFHIINYDHYKNYYSNNEVGIRLISELNINKLIYNILWKPIYYNNFKINILTF